MVNATRGEEILRKLQPLLKGQEGKMLAIDTDTGDYALADTDAEAYEAACKRFGKKQFYFARVGARAAYFIGRK